MAGSNRMRPVGSLLLALALPLAPLGSSAMAAETRVAVAANFTAAANEIGAAFEKATSHKAVFSFGSTGQLYTQITQQAPFDVFLAADQARPMRLVDEGLAVNGTRFTYAFGKLVLYSKDKGFVTGGQTLKAAKFDKIAIANPVTAPYGTAAEQVMKALGVYEALKSKIVQGSNIAQTYQFVSTGNAQVGFVALSQVVLSPDGSRWIVPEKLYTPIAQEAVLLKRAADNAAAKAFIAFLKGPEARAVKENYGYGAGE